MKKVIALTTTFLILSFSMFIISCSQKVQQENILAEFKDNVVTLDELEQEISELPEWKQSKYKDQAGREEYLTLMAESRMLLNVAVDKGLDKDTEIVKQTREYKDQLMVKELVKREVDDKLAVTDMDLKQYYEEHKDDYVEPEKVAVTEITVKDEEKANEIMEKIKGGADFAEMAKEMDAKGESFGPGQGNEGKTKPFSRDSFSSAREFVEIAFSLEVDGISDTIAQPLGDETYYMIVRLDEQIPSRQQEFSEVESKIRRTVEKQKKKERMDRWLEMLKVENKFQLYPERISEVAEVAEAEEDVGARDSVPVQETAEMEAEGEGEQETPDEATEEKEPDTEEEKLPSGDSEQLE